MRQVWRAHTHTLIVPVNTHCAVDLCLRGGSFFIFSLRLKCKTTIFELWPWKKSSWSVRGTAPLPSTRTPRFHNHYLPSWCGRWSMTHPFLYLCTYQTHTALSLNRDQRKRSLSNETAPTWHFQWDQTASSMQVCQLFICFINSSTNKATRKKRAKEASISVQSAAVIKHQRFNAREDMGWMEAKWNSCHFPRQQFYNPESPSCLMILFVFVMLQAGQEPNHTVLAWLHPFNQMLFICNITSCNDWGLLRRNSRPHTKQKLSCGVGGAPLTLTVFSIL